MLLAKRWPLKTGKRHNDGQVRSSGVRRPPHQS
jgi:hypothetical protein